MSVNIASVGKLATESEAIPQRNELWSAEAAERWSQAHNGKRLANAVQVSRDECERTKARSEGERAPLPDEASAGHGAIETTRL
jgi:hypothetical protein